MDPQAPYQQYQPSAAPIQNGAPVPPYPQGPGQPPAGPPPQGGSQMPAPQGYTEQPLPQQLGRFSIPDGQPYGPPEQLGPPPPTIEQPFMPAPQPAGPPPQALYAPPTPQPAQQMPPESVYQQAPPPMPGPPPGPMPGQMPGPMPAGPPPQGMPQGSMQPGMPSAPGQPSQPAQPGQGFTPQPKSNPNSTQNTLLIAEIRDGVVIMNDGSYRSVLMMKSINFDLMSPQEREAVENAYQGFLNSLYFPIQIFVRSQKVDIRPYIEKLDKIRSEHDNMLLALLMEDYIDFMSNIAQQTNIMDKKFYIVVPYFPTVELQKAVAASKNVFTSIFGQKEQHIVINENELEKAKTELRNRVQAVLSGLMQCGVQGIPLDTQELIELYYDAYNPDTATRQQLTNLSDLTAPVITKGQGMAPQPNLDKEGF